MVALQRKCSKHKAQTPPAFMASHKREQNKSPGTSHSKAELPTKPAAYGPLGSMVVTSVLMRLRLYGRNLDMIPCLRRCRASRCRAQEGAQEQGLHGSGGGALCALGLALGLEDEKCRQHTILP